MPMGKFNNFLALFNAIVLVLYLLPFIGFSYQLAVFALALNVLLNLIK